MNSLVTDNLVTAREHRQKVNQQTNVSGNVYKAGGNINHVEGDAIIAGGDIVAGNKNEAIVQELRALLEFVREAAQSGRLPCTVHFPTPQLSTDNAVMTTKTKC